MRQINKRKDRMGRAVTCKGENFTYVYSVGGMDIYHNKPNTKGVLVNHRSGVIVTDDPYPLSEHNWRK